MNVSISAKGLASWDVTAEYATPEETKAALSAAIDGVREVIREKGLIEAGAAV
jgi:molybdopterin biosynthesis enzyme MoaB